MRSTLPELAALICAGYHSLFLLVSLISTCFWDAEKYLLLAYGALEDLTHRYIPNTPGIDFQ